MANKPKRDVDEDLVRQLAKLLDETGLTEIEYGRDGWHIRVSGGATHVAPALPATPAPAPAVTAVETAAPASTGEDVDLTNAVTSPMVGVVFTSSDPDAPPFVKVGDQVTEGQTLLLIEAMKVFNPITATRAGKVTKILISNSSPVEFGEPLLILE
ncbi:MAG: acetyl-CoA carboxylase biotin carboxyl carrier protein [Alphaproteobacteria bacterium]|jgi:acetyl-CoA carboxylase biotin carboxyl carrier protein|nr:acetyl-CoA carboxylase biotin carboxyl carrier protein [Alphaproteobacteria bacterium]MBT7942540.1 acetyl-CoA carboxylase biotin carboxyl carrier protein [Alphaproteobacteria bacterium]